MKYYHPAHCVFFEAAFADWPTELLEWLAQDIPALEQLTPTNNGGMIIKDSTEWKEIVCNAHAELLPDHCFHCGITLGEIPGGQVREGCPNCIDTIPEDFDSYLTPLLRITLALSAATDEKYFSELTGYLLCCHIAWQRNLGPLPEPIEEAMGMEPAKMPSLLDKLKK